MRLPELDRWRVAPVLAAAAVAGLYLILDLRTGDLAAHLYRADLFAREGFTIWNGNWYGGHHTPAYSVLSPPLAWLLVACKASDGTYWALQRWRRSQANYGIAPWKPGHGAWELRLSHWTGEVAKLEAWADWYYSGRWHHLFGRLTYLGVPVHGFGSTNVGNPKDRYGRNVYIDVLDSAYGPGWRRAWDC